MMPRTLLTITALSIALSLSASAQSAGPSALSEAPFPDDPSFLLQQTTAAVASTERGTISGVVTDTSGSLIPGAVITLTQPSQPGLRDTTSDSSGHFAFTNLRPGKYNLLVAAPSFRTYASPIVALQPGEHSDLPPIQLAVAASTTIDVSADSTAVAEQELKRETSQRIVGIIPNFYTSFVYDAAPLNTRQKFKLNLRSVTDPTLLLGVAISSGIEQANNTFPEWGNSDAASYGKRFAAGYGDALLIHTFSYALYPAIFHQDPRYFYLGPTNKTSTRIWHALSYSVITRGDNGRHQINFSRLLGSASAGAASSFYHPASEGPAKLAGINLGIGIGQGALQAIFREFVWAHFTTHVPAYANGRTSLTPSKIK
ncbi:MAG: carboxypeptidase-like regulatory domain-containing protein [Acidobacteriota bacterium]